MKIRPEVVSHFARYEDGSRLSITHSWQSRRDEYGHTHCHNCGQKISVGDRCLVEYLEYVSIVFCMECYGDNPDVFPGWMNRSDKGVQQPCESGGSPPLGSCPRPTPPRGVRMQVEASVTTEIAWLACNTPQPMLEFVRGMASQRKLRLFAVACCRLVWDWFPQLVSREAVEVAERYADGKASRQELLAGRRAADPRWKEDEDTSIASAWTCAWATTDFAGWRAANDAARTAAITPRPDAWFRIIRRLRPTQEMREESKAACQQMQRTQLAAQAVILRDLFHPFRRSRPLPRAVLRWNDETAVHIAQSIYNERSFTRLSILADALLDAGCEDEELIRHCRTQGPHFRGCWALDLFHPTAAEGINGVSPP